MFNLKNLVTIIILSLSVSSCLPAIFTATTASSLAVAGDRSLGEAIDDTKITAHIKATLAKESLKKLYTKLSVTVLKGQVFYTGVVSSEEDMLKAVEIAWKCNGVKEVVNELTLDHNSDHFDLAQYTRDSLITAQVKSKLLFHRDIKFVNYTVITVKDIVYLFGIARSQEELEKVADIASRVNKVGEVISHVRLHEKI